MELLPSIRIIMLINITCIRYIYIQQTNFMLINLIRLIVLPILITGWAISFGDEIPGGTRSSGDEILLGRYSLGRDPLAWTLLAGPPPWTPLAGPLDLPGGALLTGHILAGLSWLDLPGWTKKNN